MTFTGIDKNELEYYVYRLIDPRNGETFYVGKGKDDRVFQHVKAVNKAMQEAFEKMVDEDEKDKTDEKDKNDENDEKQKDRELKFKRIISIENAGFTVQPIIHRHGMKEQTAFAVEAALIDAYPGLTNEQSGHDSHKGCMHAQEIINKYNLPKFPETDKKIIFINVNGLEAEQDKDAIYTQVRAAWKLSKERADKAEYIVAVKRGIALGIFEMDEKKWQKDYDRYLFDRKPAPDKIWKEFIGKNGQLLKDDMKHGSGNPIRYYNM